MNKRKHTKNARNKNNTLPEICSRDRNIPNVMGKGGRALLFDLCIMFGSQTAWTRPMKYLNSFPEALCFIVAHYGPMARHGYPLQAYIVLLLFL